MSTNWADLVNGTPMTDEQRLRFSSLRTMQQRTSGLTLSQSGGKPPAPGVFTAAAASSAGYSFAFSVVDDPRVYGYFIYRSTAGASGTAQRIAFLPQVPTALTDHLSYSDSVGTGTTNYYWVSAVNQYGVESPRVSLQSGLPGTVSADSGTGVIASSVNGYVWKMQGTLANGFLNDSYMPFAAYSPIDIQAKVRVAPAGSAATVDVYRNGAVMVTLGIANGGFASSVVTTLPALSALDKLQINVTAAGSLQPGEDLLVRIR